MPEPSNLTPSSSQVPGHARVVIIGGGVIGCSVAYHLTKLGWSDVVLLERKQLTCGTTWHAAGFVAAGGVVSGELETLLAKESLELYGGLEEETEQATGFRRVGLVMLACNQDRLEQQRRVLALTRFLGEEGHEVPSSDVKKMWPLARTDDVLAGFYYPDVHRVNPIDVTMALAKGARMRGARILEGTSVVGITRDEDRVTGVTTDRGPIEAEYVVNCGGMWARELGLMAGVDVPLHAAEHYYLVTEAVEGVHPGLPALIDPDAYAYWGEESGGALLLGFFEPGAAPWGMGGIPEDFAFGELPIEWERMAPYIEEAMQRIPVSLDAGIHHVLNGPESFTPDLGFYLGDAPGLPNHFIAAGFNSGGILWGGGAGNVLAHWIVDGHPPVDLSDVSLHRVLPLRNNPRYLRDRTTELLGLSWCVWPNPQFETARNIRKSVLHDRLVAEGACFTQSPTGWELPDWFAPTGAEPKYEHSWGRQNWFEFHAAEHRAARENVVLIDYSSMSKFLVQGHGAEQVLNRVCANNVAVPVGQCVYTQWLNERGTIEADLTVSRIGQDSFVVMTSDTTHGHVYTWLKRHIPVDADVHVTDVTSFYAALSVQGPSSRELLSCLSDSDFSDEAFPFRAIREINLAYARVIALRLSYIGELGWELYIPTECAVGAYDAILEAGSGFGLLQAGLETANSLRLEKGYRNYGDDLDTDWTPLEAGLVRFVDFDKACDFIGRESLLRQRESGVLRKRLVQFLLQDPEPLLWGEEPILRNGVPVGLITSGAYGHSLGGAVGLGYVGNPEGVTVDSIQEGSFEIDVAGVRVPAVASLRPLYDPENDRMRG